MSSIKEMNSDTGEQFIGILKELQATIKGKSYDEACQHAQQILNNKQKYPSSIVQYAVKVIERHASTINNGYHLSINPSYANKLEIEFWNSVHDETKALGAAKIKELRFRKYAEETLHKDSIVHPARLGDLFNLLSKKYKYSMTSLPGWVTASDVALHVDWEHRRWQIDKYDHKVEKGFVQLCWYIDSFVANSECVSVITSNKLDHPNRLGFLAAQRLGKAYTFVERSPFMSHLVEPRGMFGESMLENYLVTSPANEVNIDQKELSTARTILTENIYGFRPQETKPMETAEQSERFLFFPLDNLIWTGWEPLGHPQGRIDYPNFWNFGQLLTLISEFCENNNLKFIVKPHPSDKEYYRFAKAFPKISFETDKDLASLIEHAAIIVCGLTKVAFNAAALGKNVITIAENPANYLPNVHNCVDESDLITKMNDAMHENAKVETGGLDLTLSRTKAYYTSSESMFLRYIAAPQKVAKNNVQATPAPYNLKVKTTKVDLTKRIAAAISGQRIPVLFDISRMINVNLSHSGISKFTLILYRELCNISEVDVIPYINSLPKSRDCLPALELNATFDALSIDFAYHPGRAQLESIEERFVYISPHWSLPPVGKQAERIITMHDVLHLTESVYEGTEVRKVTKEIIDSIKPSDRVVSVSEFSKLELKKIRPDLQNMYVVNLPPVLNKLVAGSRSEIKASIRALSTKLRRSYVLIPVQGDPRKRLDMMVEAGSVAVAKSSGLHCIFFGKAASKTLITESINGTALKLGDNCHFVESPSDQELHHLYQNALTTLYLSDSEGYGLPPLEALAAGCLPIARMVTGLCDALHGYSHGLAASASLQVVCDKIFEFKSYAPTRYREEIIRTQRAMRHQLGMCLGDEYYNVLYETWGTTEAKS